MSDYIGRFLFVSGKPHVFPDESRFSKKPSGVYCIFPDDSRFFRGLIRDLQYIPGRVRKERYFLPLSAIMPLRVALKSSAAASWSRVRCIR